MRRKIRTDLEILNAIHKRHHRDFVAFARDDPTRSAKPYVPIDVAAVAGDLRVDVDSVFGRLYYDLNERYGYEKGGGVSVPFFTLKAGSDANCVNFPYMESVIAKLREERRRQQTATAIAVISLVVSAFSIGVAVATAV